MKTNNKLKTHNRTIDEKGRNRHVFVEIIVVFRIYLHPHMCSMCMSSEYFITHLRKYGHLISLENNAHYKLLYQQMSVVCSKAKNRD